jgi:hypothetical protein
VLTVVAGAPSNSAMLAFWAVLATVVTLTVPSSPVTHESRLRPADGIAAHALERGRACCPTIGALVQELEASDLIVYVETAALANPASARTVLMGAVKNNRYVRVTLNRMTSPEGLIELLGHELQHAVEIARAREVRDRDGMVALYQRIGLRKESTNRFETQLARDTGHRVRAEIASRPSLAAFNARAASDNSRRTRQ